MADPKDLFAERFAVIEKELYRIAFLWLKNRDDALDCVQEAALRCFKGYPRLRDQKYFKTWAVRITINCAKDILRSRGYEVSIEDCESAVEPTESVEQEVLSRVTLDRLLDSLSEEERGALVLKHAYGYSFPQIAEILEMPLGTAKSVCYRAIEKLKKEDLG